MIDKRLQIKYPVGSIHTATVVNHLVFGVFVKFEEKEVDCLGLIQVTDIGASNTWNSTFLPPIGDLISVVVLGYTPDNRNQIWLKPNS